MRVGGEACTTTTTTTNVCNSERQHRPYIGGTVALLPPSRSMRGRGLHAAAAAAASLIRVGDSSSNGNSSNGSNSNGSNVPLLKPHRRQQRGVNYWRDLDLGRLVCCADTGYVTLRDGREGRQQQAPLLLQLPQLVIDLSTFRDGWALSLLDVTRCEEDAVRWFGRFELALDGCIGVGIARHPGGCIIYNDNGRCALQQPLPTVGEVAATVIVAPRFIPVCPRSRRCGVVGLYVCGLSILRWLA